MAGTLPDSNLQQKNRKLIVQLLAVTLGMFAFGFALVPLYEVFCDITGINGKNYSVAQQRQLPGQEISDRQVKLQFITNLNDGLTVEFAPVSRQIDVNPGKEYRVDFTAKNTSNKDLRLQAVPSVSPGLAASYLHKIECFCFEQQTIKAGETVTMPLFFFIDPQVPDDYHTMTLSYTLFKLPAVASAEARNQNPEPSL